MGLSFAVINVTRMCGTQPNYAWVVVHFRFDFEYHNECYISFVRLAVLLRHVRCLFSFIWVGLFAMPALNISLAYRKQFATIAQLMGEKCAGVRRICVHFSTYRFNTAHTLFMHDGQHVRLIAALYL